MKKRLLKVVKSNLKKPNKKLITSVNTYGGDGCGNGCGMLKW